MGESCNRAPGLEACRGGLVEGRVASGVALTLRRLLGSGGLSFRLDVGGGVRALSPGIRPRLSGWSTRVGERRVHKRENGPNLLSRARLPDVGLGFEQLLTYAFPESWGTARSGSLLWVWNWAAVERRLRSVNGYRLWNTIVWNVVLFRSGGRCSEDYPNDGDCGDH